MNYYNPPLYQLSYREMRRYQKGLNLRPNG